VYIFQSEQVNCDSDFKITLLIFKSPDLNPLNYHVGCDTGKLYMPKPTDIAELKTAVLSIWDDLPQEFTDKQSCHFKRDFDSCCCSWQALWTFSL